MSAQLYLDGLPASVTEEDLRTLCSECGSVLSLRIARVDGRSIGIAEVQMARTEEAERAIHRLHHTRIDGHLLLVFRGSRMNSDFNPGGDSSAVTT